MPKMVAGISPDGHHYREVHGFCQKHYHKSTAPSSNIFWQLQAKAGKISHPTPLNGLTRRTSCYNLQKERFINKVLFSFGLIIAAGYFWRFFNPGGLDRHRARHALSVTVLHFFLPALAFGLVTGARVDRSFIAVPLTASVVTLFGIAAGFAAYKLLPWLRDINRPAFGVMVLAASFGNVTYLGLPVITEMLGAQYGYVAILYDLLAATPVLLSVGVLIAARYGSGKAAPMAASLKRVLKLPPLWGVAAGMAVHATGAAVPQIILDAAQLMGKAVIPVMTFTVGLALDFRDVNACRSRSPRLHSSSLRRRSWPGGSGRGSVYQRKPSRRSPSRAPCR
jgi:predicted permease